MEGSSRDGYVLLGHAWPISISATDRIAILNQSFRELACAGVCRLGLWRSRVFARFSDFPSMSWQQGAVEQLSRSMALVRVRSLCRSHVPRAQVPRYTALS